MMQTKYRQTVIDLTGVEQANRDDLLELDERARADTLKGIARGIIAEMEEIGLERIGYDARGVWQEPDTSEASVSELFDHSHEENKCPVLRCTGTIAILGGMWSCDTCDWSAAASKSDEQCAELRNGTARYNTPREDAILYGFIAAVLATLGAAIWLCVHYGAAIDAWKAW